MDVLLGVLLVVFCLVWLVKKVDCLRLAFLFAVLDVRYFLRASPYIKAFIALHQLFYVVSSYACQ